MADKKEVGNTGRVASGKVVDGIPIELFRAIFEDKRNVFVSGPSGCGKSYLARKIKEYCNNNSIKCAITSTTGVSAYAIGGTTIHRWAGIQLADKPANVIIEKILKSPDKLKRWRETQIVIIDEISMLGKHLIEYINEVGNSVCQGRKSLLMEGKKSCLFGGKQLIFTGDFLQLPPVDDEYAFKSDVWNALNLFMFRMVHPYRYPDPKHFEMLMRLREGTPSEEDVKKIETRVDAYNKYQQKLKKGDIPEIRPTILYSLKRDVEALNMAELEKLEGDIFVYDADDIIIIKTNKKGNLIVNPKNVNRTDYVEYMDQIVSPEVILKIGAQVLLTKNIDVEEGLVNGARGVVTACDDDAVKVKFLNGLEVRITAQSYEFEDEKVNVTRVQIPLILAWALSVHKSQGSTIDFAIIDIGPTVFGPAMGFVAMSRVKTMEGILVKNFMCSRIKADPDALEFETMVAKQSISFQPLDLEKETENDNKEKEIPNGETEEQGEISDVDSEETEEKETEKEETKKEKEETEKIG